MEPNLRVAFHSFCGAAPSRAYDLESTFQHWLNSFPRFLNPERASWMSRNPAWMKINNPSRPTRLRCRRRNESSQEIIFLLATGERRSRDAGALMHGPGSRTYQFSSGLQKAVVALTDWLSLVTSVARQH